MRHRLIGIASAATGVSLFVVAAFSFHVAWEIKADLNHPAFYSGPSEILFGLMQILLAFLAFGVPRKKLLPPMIALFVLYIPFFVVSMTVTQRQLARLEALQKCATVFSGHNALVAQRLEDLRVVLNQYAMDHHGQYPLLMNSEFERFVQTQRELSDGPAYGRGPLLNPLSNKFEMPHLRLLKNTFEEQEDFIIKGEPGSVEYSPSPDGRKFFARAFGCDGHLLIGPTRSCHSPEVMLITNNCAPLRYTTQWWTKRGDL